MMTPESFISHDFTPDLTEDRNLLKQNEYFAKRWWEIQIWDYNAEIQLFLITTSDMQKVEKKLIIDSRPFKDYNVCHLKGSFHMSTYEDMNSLKVYCRFIRAYQLLYPDNFIIIVGEESDIGLELGLTLLKVSKVG
jgi:hypothetical protein